jgi:general secretion pathway protein H
MRAKSTGFTLLELLLTLFIVSVMATLAVVGFQENPQQVLNREAKRLIMLLEASSEEAIMQGQELALSFDAQGYQFLGFDVEALAWAELTEKPFVAHQLPEKMQLFFSLDGDEMDPDKVAKIQQLSAINANNTAVPMLLLLSSGETSAYTIELQHDKAENSVHIKGDGMGSIELDE